MNFSKKLVDGVHARLVAENVGTVGKSPTQEVVTYILAINPQDFFTLHQAKFHAKFQHQCALQDVHTKLDMELWIQCALELAPLLNLLNDEFPPLVQMKYLCPGYPLWFAFIVYVALTLKDAPLAFPFVQAGFSADPQNLLRETHELKKRLAAFKREDHRQNVSLLLRVVFEQLYK